MSYRTLYRFALVLVALLAITPCYAQVLHGQGRLTINNAIYGKNGKGRKGVPMGSDLPAVSSGAKTPTFLVAAMKDPIGANLDRIQIVKGWVDKDSKPHEQIYNVAWGDANTRKLLPNGKLPPVGNTVDVTRATWTNTIGDPDLVAVWQDPHFDPSQRAFYYARVLEIPTPRWTDYDVVRFKVKMTPDVPMTHQKRAWTSPIWYTPKP